MDTTFTIRENITSFEHVAMAIPPGTTKVVCTHKNLTSLKGIENFPDSVKTLNVSDNQISSLEGLCGSTVTELFISYNQISSLEGLSGSMVTKLHIFKNRITSLEGLCGSVVTTLKIYNNQISSIEGLCGSVVTTLDVSYNQITSLEGLSGSTVTTLYIYDNPVHQEFLERGGDENFEKFKKDLEMEDDLSVKQPEDF